MTDLVAEARHALHLDISCPVCHAGFSEPCRSSSGAVRVQVHAARKLPPARWAQDELFAVDEVT